MLGKSRLPDLSKKDVRKNKKRTGRKRTGGNNIFNFLNDLSNNNQEVNNMKVIKSYEGKTLTINNLIIKSKGE